jgi:cellulase
MPFTRSITLAGLSLLGLAAAQSIGKTTPEVHPKLLTSRCTKARGCVLQETSVVLDALSHPITDVGSASCSACTTVAGCAKACAIQGANYKNAGVTTVGDSLHLQMYLNGNAVSPRVYLLDPTGKEYSMVKLLNQEIAFTADVSNLPCGMNGALYLSAMEQSGGRSKYNPAGAQYGTGYCDAQCGGSSWINGEKNVNNSGLCCQEMDLWEANARSTALTPHACTTEGLYACSGDACGSNGVCDKSGCGYNPYGLGSHSYYGYGDTVNTNKTMTVVTQFLTTDNTAHGTLKEIRRLYVQNGKIIGNAVVPFNGSTIDSITDSYCQGSSASFQQRGGLAQMGKALGEGMVLIFSIWNDNGQFMDWLDEGNAGPCNATEGNPALIQANDPSTSVTFSNIKWGDINSTYSNGYY